MPKGNPRPSKAEIDAALRQKAKIERTKTLARQAFSALTNLPTIHDAQTVVNAAAGHIKYGLVTEEKKLHVQDLQMELGKGKSPVDHAVTLLVELFANENAREVMEVLELMGNKLPEHLASVGLKQPMSTLTADEFIAR